MIKIIILKLRRLLLSTLLLLTLNSCNSDNILIGEWHGVSKSMAEVKIVFGKENRFFMYSNGKNFFEQYDKPLFAEYSFDTEKQPNLLTVNGINKENNIPIFTIFILIEKENATTIKIDIIEVVSYAEAQNIDFSDPKYKEFTDGAFLIHKRPSK